MVGAGGGSRAPGAKPYPTTAENKARRKPGLKGLRVRGSSPCFTWVSLLLLDVSAGTGRHNTHPGQQHCTGVKSAADRQHKPLCKLSLVGSGVTGAFPLVRLQRSASIQGEHLPKVVRVPCPPCLALRCSCLLLALPQDTACLCAAHPQVISQLSHSGCASACLCPAPLFLSGVVLSLGPGQGAWHEGLDCICSLRQTKPLIQLSPALLHRPS